MSGPVVIVMAMQAEADPVLDAIGAASESEIPQRWGSVPFRWFESRSTLGHIVVAVNGADHRFGVDSIGTVAATMNTYAASLQFEPRVIVSAGTAGGWASQGAEVGDVYVSDSILFHDRRIQLPGFDRYGVGSFPVHELPESLRTPKTGAFKTGTVTTGDSLELSNADQEMIDANGGAVKEMEAAAVAKVAETLQIPMLAVKAITDLVDAPAPTGEQFFANLTVATARLAEALPAVLAEI